MFGKWIRNIIARSIYKEILTCKDCEPAENGFDVFYPCAKHKDHIDFHNVLTSQNE